MQGADDLLRQADDLLAQMAKGDFKRPLPSGEPQTRGMEDPGPGYQLQCDVNGCTIVPVAKQEAARTPSSELLLEKELTLRHMLEDAQAFQASEEMRALQNESMQSML